MTFPDVSGLYSYCIKERCGGRWSDLTLEMIWEPDSFAIFAVNHSMIFNIVDIDGFVIFSKDQGLSCHCLTFYHLFSPNLCSR